MCSRTRWMVLPIAVVAAAVVLALAATPAVSLASDGVDYGVARTTVGAAAAPDTLPPAGTTAPAAVDLQMMDGDNDGFWDSGGWVIMPIMMVLFLGSVLGVAVWGIRQFTRDRERGRSPLDIAKERLARGEITKEEFDRIRGDLA